MTPCQTGNRTQATLVGCERSHHCPPLLPQVLKLIYLAMQGLTNVKIRDSPRYREPCIPANPQSMKIWRRLANICPKISEGFRRWPKIFRLPTTAEDFPTTSEDNRGCRRIFDDFKTGITNCFSPKKNWISIKSVFKQLCSLWSVGRGKLVWMREVYQIRVRVIMSLSEFAAWIDLIMMVLEAILSIIRRQIRLKLTVFVWKVI